MSQGLHHVLVVCFLTTHIGFCLTGVLLLFFIYHLGQMTHIFSYFHLTPICLTHSHSFCLFIFLTMMSSLCSPFLMTSLLYYKHLES